MNCIEATFDDLLAARVPHHVGVRDWMEDLIA